VKVHAGFGRLHEDGGLEDQDESLHRYGRPAVTAHASVVLLVGGIIMEFFLTSNPGSGSSGESFDPVGSGDNIVSHCLPPLGRRLEDIDHICTSCGLDAHNIVVGRCPTGDAGVPCGGLCGNNGVEE
jgi:hypothetical protein